MDNTFIKLSRKIQSWRWYQDANTMRVFIHILLNANVYDHDFENITVKRGQWVTSQKRIAEQLNLSLKNVRTALEHLKTTGEVAIKTTSKYSIITVFNYNQYQKVAHDSAVDRQSAGTQSAVNRQQYKKGKEYIRMVRKRGRAHSQLTDLLKMYFYLMLSLMNWNANIQVITKVKLIDYQNILRRAEKNTIIISLYCPIGLKRMFQKNLIKNQKMNPARLILMRLTHLTTWGILMFRPIKCAKCGNDFGMLQIRKCPYSKSGLHICVYCCKHCRFCKPVSTGFVCEFERRESIESENTR